MATDLEIRERQKILLTTLLKLKAMNEGSKIKGMAEAISLARVGMNKEDIADCIKEVDELMELLKDE
ncbi:MAG: hypothetical protein FWF59_08875 [Turicibacter sp.]|nr:hypothetical protein [Turicibacter sp.]